MMDASKEELKTTALLLDDPIANMILSTHFRFHSCEYSSSVESIKDNDINSETEKTDKNNKISENILTPQKTKEKKKIDTAIKNNLLMFCKNSESVLNLIKLKWQSIVGDVFYKNITPFKLNKKTLMVKSSNPLITQDFIFSRDEVIENINKIFDVELVTKIKITQ